MLRPGSMRAAFQAFAAQHPQARPLRVMATIDQLAPGSKKWRAHVGVLGDARITGRAGVRYGAALVDGSHTVTLDGDGRPV